MNSTPKNNSGGIFDRLKTAVSGATNAVTKAVSGNSKNTTRKNGNKSPNNGAVQPAYVGAQVNDTSSNASSKPNSTAPQMGGVAPLNFRYPANMQQPSDAVMRWATTAGMPAPSNMHGVAQGGGKRSTGKRRTKRRSTKRKTHMRKSYKKVKGGKKHSKRSSKRHTKKHGKSHSKRRN
jgi:hypothetical protein